MRFAFARFAVPFRPVAPPPGELHTNMPMLPGGPSEGAVILPIGDAGSTAPAWPREGHILPLPLAGGPPSLIAWGSWIGL